MAGYMAQRAVRKMRSPSCDCQHHHRSRAEWSGLFSAFPGAHFAGAKTQWRRSWRGTTASPTKTTFPFCQAATTSTCLAKATTSTTTWTTIRATSTCGTLPQFTNCSTCSTCASCTCFTVFLRDWDSRRKSSESSSSCCTEKSRCSSTGHRLRPLSGDLRVLKRSCVKHIVHPDFQIRWRPGAQREALPCRWFAASGELQAHRKSRHDNAIQEIPAQSGSDLKWEWLEETILLLPGISSKRSSQQQPSLITGRKSFA